MEPQMSGAGKSIYAEDSVAMRKLRLFRADSENSPNYGSIFQDRFIPKSQAPGFHTIDNSSRLLAPEVTPPKLLPFDNFPRLCVEPGDYTNEPRYCRDLPFRLAVPSLMDPPKFTQAWCTHWYNELTRMIEFVCDVAGPMGVVSPHVLNARGRIRLAPDVSTVMGKTWIKGKECRGFGAERKGCKGSCWKHSVDKASSVSDSE
ncbi:uncharacterized protein LOC113293040 [Papaver somniferum]|uniref:uncharacterized protein LOC113293040 n=1 Tax=Papaver somniferum TaxID=3469 RepID=UPI000E6F9F5E|nr:uncharacterized protein LOC113293040 [Papaver somniferum]